VLVCGVKLCAQPQCVCTPRRNLSVSSALKRIDSESVLFFLGILMAVSSLEASGLLRVRLTRRLGRTLPA
jgi:Na+/H+ antiporter NhaD/arsenite permease-like protein